MSFFKKLFGNTDDEPDATLGYGKANDFRQLVRQRQFDKAEKLYNQVAWEGRSLIVAGISEAAACRDFIREWVKQVPDSSLANLCNGVVHTQIAWEHRTNQLAHRVTDDQATRFFEHLMVARQSLQKAEFLNPADPTILSALLPVYMGLELPLEESRELFDRLKQLEPTHLGGHIALINSLTPKWGGSIEDMTAFAETYQNDSPVLITLALLSLINQWENHHLEGDYEAYKTFFQWDETKASIKRLYQQFMEQNDTSLLAPIARNYFAFVLIKAGFRQDYLAEVKKLRGKMYPYPWKRVGITTYSKLLTL
ncbi:hypothetical protein ACFPMF_25375 [Larkinella bovis]|uniref:DUF4034 domain-containing protein n=1 Tax=Larkinella bovis TaxID=683041 RepID=A0ABW0IJP9_9BACT